MTDPQTIFEHLNGVIVGHYVMKKALSVSIFNHFYKSKATRETLRCEDPSSGSEVEGPPPPPRRRSYTGESLGERHSRRLSDRRGSSEMVAGSPVSDGTFLSPIVS